MHSVIERAKNKLDSGTVIAVPWDWQQFIRQCRFKDVIEVFNMKCEDFKDFNEEINNLIDAALAFCEKYDIDGWEDFKNTTGQGKSRKNLNRSQIINLFSQSTIFIVQISNKFWTGCQAGCLFDFDDFFDFENHKNVPFVYTCSHGNVTRV